jgi:hypothetical protein
MNFDKIFNIVTFFFRCCKQVRIPNYLSHENYNSDDEFDSLENNVSEDDNIPNKIFVIIRD